MEAELGEALEGEAEVLLEALAADCDADGRYSFLLSASPEPVVGGYGAPVNPVAVK